MADLDDISKKATDFLNSKKVQDAIKSEKVEGVSDKILNGVADLADRVTGGKHKDKIESARDAADKKIGTDSAGPTAAPAPKIEPKIESKIEQKNEAGGLRGKLIDPRP